MTFLGFRNLQLPDGYRALNAGTVEGQFTKTTECPLLETSVDEQRVAKREQTPSCPHLIALFQDRVATAGATPVVTLFEGEALHRYRRQEKKEGLDPALNPVSHERAERVTYCMVTALQNGDEYRVIGEEKGEALDPAVEEYMLALTKEKTADEAKQKEARRSILSKAETAREWCFWAQLFLAYDPSLGVQQAVKEFLEKRINDLDLDLLTQYREQIKKEFPDIDMRPFMIEILGRVLAEKSAGKGKLSQRLLSPTDLIELQSYAEYAREKKSYDCFIEIALVLCLLTRGKNELFPKIMHNFAELNDEAMTMRFLTRLREFTSLDEQACADLGKDSAHLQTCFALLFSTPAPKLKVQLTLGIASSSSTGVLTLDELPKHLSQVAHALLNVDASLQLLEHFLDTLEPQYVLPADVSLRELLLQNNPELVQRLLATQANDLLKLPAKLLAALKLPHVGGSITELVFEKSPGNCEQLFAVFPNLCKIVTASCYFSKFFAKLPRLEELQVESIYSDSIMTACSTLRTFSVKELKGQREGEGDWSFSYGTLSQDQFFDIILPLYSNVETLKFGRGKFVAAAPRTFPRIKTFEVGQCMTACRTLHTYFPNLQSLKMGNAEDLPRLGALPLLRSLTITDQILPGALKEPLQRNNQIDALSVAFRAEAYNPATKDPYTPLMDALKPLRGLRSLTMQVSHYHGGDHFSAAHARELLASHPRLDEVSFLELDKKDLPRLIEALIPLREIRKIRLGVEMWGVMEPQVMAQIREKLPNCELDLKIIPRPSALELAQLSYAVLAPREMMRNPFGVMLQGQEQLMQRMIRGRVWNQFEELPRFIREGLIEAGSSLKSYSESMSCLNKEPMLHLARVFPKLENLDVMLPSYEIKELIAAIGTHFKELRTLRISSDSIRRDDFFKDVSFETWKGLSHLRSFATRGAQLPPEALRGLAAAVPALTAMSIESGYVEEAHFESLGRFRALEELRITGYATVSDQRALEKIGASLLHLKTLILPSMAKLTVENVAHLRGNRALTSLHVGLMPAAVIRALAVACPQLTELRMDGQEGVTEEQIAALAAFPGLKILHMPCKQDTAFWKALEALTTVEELDFQGFSSSTRIDEKEATSLLRMRALKRLGGVSIYSYSDQEAEERCKKAFAAKGCTIIPGDSYYDRHH